MDAVGERLAFEIQELDREDDDRNDDDRHEHA